MALKRSLRCGTWAQSPPRGLAGPFLMSSGKGAEFQHACYRCQHACYGPNMRFCKNHMSTFVAEFCMMLQNSNMMLQNFNMAFQNSEHACYRYEHQCYRYEHACYRCEHGKISVYLSPQKQEHHRHPTVPTHETRQIPTHNTLVCASRTNNTYTFHALPRKILCQPGTSPKSHCPPAPAW